MSIEEKIQQRTKGVNIMRIEEKIQQRIVELEEQQQLLKHATYTPIILEHTISELKKLLK